MANHLSLEPENSWLNKEKKQPRLPNCRCWHEAPLQDNRRCGFHMKFFCCIDECWHLQTQKSSNMPPMRHCHHRKHDPLLVLTTKDLWTDDMIKDAKAACDVSIQTADVANLMNKKTWNQLFSCPDFEDEVAFPCQKPSKD